jgi:hypothetical protein
MTRADDRPEEGVVTVWVLDDDDQAVSEDGTVSDGDLVVRRTDDLLRVGVAQPGDARPIDWRAEVDLRLLPERDQLAAADEDDEPLRRLEHADGLETALAGVLTAERDRGA